ncbi:hypothetical protein INR49_018582 [Caranx melampygus]|nr:hypothetical protein INR49_018582 [Caranx melampygus]
MLCDDESVKRRLTMMEYTSATMLMGHTGQKQERLRLTLDGESGAAAASCPTEPDLTATLWPFCSASRPLSLSTLTVKEVDIFIPSPPARWSPPAASPSPGSRDAERLLHLHPRLTSGSRLLHIHRFTHVQRETSSGNLPFLNIQHPHQPEWELLASASIQSRHFPLSLVCSWGKKCDRLSLFFQRKKDGGGRR